MNFNEIFRKYVTYVDIKSDLKTKLYIYSLQAVYFLKYVLGDKAWIVFCLMKLQY